MLTYICDTHNDYPKRISANNIFYTEYKDQRPFFFHDVLIQEPMPVWSEPLVPTIDDFKDKYSYVTNMGWTLRIKCILIKGPQSIKILYFEKKGQIRCLRAFSLTQIKI